jgi:hypothetical protein
MYLCIQIYLASKTKLNNTSLRNWITAYFKSVQSASRACRQVNTALGFDMGIPRSGLKQCKCKKSISVTSWQTRDIAHLRLATRAIIYIYIYIYIYTRYMLGFFQSRLLKQFMLYQKQLRLQRQFSHLISRKPHCNDHLLALYLAIILGCPFLDVEIE